MVMGSTENPLITSTIETQDLRSESSMLSTMVITDQEESSPWRREYRRPTLCVIDENNGNDVSEQYSPDHCSQSDFQIPSITVTLPDDETEFQTDHNANLRSVKNPEDSDFNKLKATTTRLNLSTRRPSVLAWKQEHLEKRNIAKPCFDVKDNVGRLGDGFTEERKQRINQALEWLRNELTAMRTQDQQLARQLLSIRHDIHQLKLKRSCEEHREMLDDVTQDMEEVQELHGISDMPLSDSYGETPLRQLGVTRMHLSARRFSTC